MIISIKQKFDWRSTLIECNSQNFIVSSRPLEIFIGSIPSGWANVLVRATIIGIHRRGWMAVDRRGRENWVGLIAGGFVRYYLGEYRLQEFHQTQRILQFSWKGGWNKKKLNSFLEFMRNVSVYRFIYKGMLLIMRDFHLKWKKYIRVQVIKCLSIFYFLDKNNSLIQLPANSLLQHFSLISNEIYIKKKKEEERILLVGFEILVSWFIEMGKHEV